MAPEVSDVDAGPVNGEDAAISIPDEGDTGEGGKLKMIVQLVKKCLGVKDIAAMSVVRLLVRLLTFLAGGFHCLLLCSNQSQTSNFLNTLIDPICLLRMFLFCFEIVAHPNKESTILMMLSKECLLWFVSPSQRILNLL